MSGNSKFIEINLEWVDSKRLNLKINPFVTSSFKFYIKDKDISCHWVGHSKMRPIDVDEFFKRKSFNYETYQTLKFNDQTEEPVDEEDITEEVCANPDKIDAESIFHPGDIPIKKVEVNEKTEEPVDAADITEETRANLDNTDG